MIKKLHWTSHPQQCKSEENKTTFLKYRKENKQFFTYHKYSLKMKDTYIFSRQAKTEKIPNQQNYIAKNAREYPAGRRKIISHGKTFLLFKSQLSLIDY